jgi:hypothetical protein
MQQEHHMGRLGTTAFLIVIGAMPALADDWPTRKAGLWDMRVTSSMGNQLDGLVLRHCIDASIASIDRLIPLYAGSLADPACPKPDVHRSGNSITVDAICNFGGKDQTRHDVVSGSLDTAYTQTVTWQGDGQPGGSVTYMYVFKWLGPCPADWKPGNIAIRCDNGASLSRCSVRAPAHQQPLPADRR